jgi:DNA-binding Xre family transcriptional regulator
MRLRIPELFEMHKMTPYAVAKASHGRISLTAAYRLQRARGRFIRISAVFLEALCDVLRVEPDELLEREQMRQRQRPARRMAQASG